MGVQPGPAFAPGAAADASAGKTIANADVKLGIGRSGGQASDTKRQAGGSKPGKAQGPEAGQAMPGPLTGKPHHAEPSIEIPAQ